MYLLFRVNPLISNAMNYLKRIYKKLFPQKEPKFLYEIIGEEAGIKSLVSKFYDVMETDPKALDCLRVHKLIDGKVEDSIKNKFFMFLSGWFGGPNLFIENFGSPKMKARHIHIPISKVEKDQWLYCMNKALDSHNKKIKQNDRYRFDGSFKALASRIQNIN
jgi:hemoglobin